MEERRYLYGDSQDPWMYQQESYLRPNYQAPKQNMSGDVAQGAMMGAAAGGPMGAAIGAGGSFLNSYLQAKAAEAQQKKQMLAQAAQTQGQGEQNALSNLISVWRGALS